MTSSRKRASNWLNAQASTGPRGAAGKAVSAMNARTHGVTGKPSRADIRRFFRILVDQNRTDAPVPAMDPKIRAAYRLAEAEAQLKRVIEAEEYTTDRLFEAEFDRNDAEPMVLGLALVLDFLPAGLFPDDRKICEVLFNQFEEPRRKWRRELKLMARYRNEAEARVRKARSAFIAASTPEKPEFPKRSQKQF